MSKKDYFSEKKYFHISKMTFIARWQNCYMSAHSINTPYFTLSDENVCATI